MATSDSKVLGVVILIRHGDRQGFYQDPIDYSSSNTGITALGNLQSFELGELIRSIYLSPSSPSFISSIDPDLVQDSQIHIRADGGGERGVIFNSAVSLLQGLFPPTPNYNSTLANGTVVVAPLGGYQTVPIESVEPDNDISLEGWADCGTFIEATNAFYNSPIFKETEAAYANFIKSLPQYLDNRPATLTDIVRIFDFINVQLIHNSTFAKQLPEGLLEQVRALANFHEQGVFTSPQLNGIGNIAGQTILPSIIDGFKNIINPTSPLKFVLEAISYKPFLSLFNMTGIARQNPQIAGIVDYASAAAFEVRQPTEGGEPVIRFKFKNGTNDQFNTYVFMNATTDVPVSTFINTMQSVALSDIPTWCTVCNNHQDRGCANYVAVANASSSSITHRDPVNPVAAGFIGATVSLTLMLIFLTLLSFFGLLNFGKHKSSKLLKSTVSK
ncbi:hypothetical protein JR316_0007161 [Psilocybe cubensis]|uniref:Uncharacterized protein n=1 Tax=Psilocybe cubensis TaxID=181762 RepID=A0ACB8GY55_PSICU|nr:hypothetical protein JR316_0007161 [Psilocybe cubensis]KAH9480561.1 hypothetical protein JR316_0007161 [Psilocybe cubensis]